MVSCEEGTDGDVPMHDRERASCGPKECFSKISMVHYPTAVFNYMSRRREHYLELSILLCLRHLPH
jgi:hypothetical protein